MGLLRLVFFGFIAMTAVYFMIAIYSRSVRREKLENRWAQDDNPNLGDEAAREAFIDEGMARYNAGIRPKLILLVYVVPTILVAVIHFLTSYN